MPQYDLYVRILSNIPSLVILNVLAYEFLKINQSINSPLMFLIINAVIKLNCKCQFSLLDVSGHYLKQILACCYARIEAQRNLGNYS